MISTGAKMIAPTASPSHQVSQIRGASPSSRVPLATSATRRNGWLIRPKLKEGLAIRRFHPHEECHWFLTENTLDPGRGVECALDNPPCRATRLFAAPTWPR